MCDSRTFLISIFLLFKLTSADNTNVKRELPTERDNIEEIYHHFYSIEWRIYKKDPKNQKYSRKLSICMLFLNNNMFKIICLARIDNLNDFSSDLSMFFALLLFLKIVKRDIKGEMCYAIRIIKFNLIVCQFLYALISEVTWPEGFSVSLFDILLKCSWKGSL